MICMISASVMKELTGINEYNALIIYLLCKRQCSVYFTLFFSLHLYLLSFNPRINLLMLLEKCLMGCLCENK